MPGRAVLLRAGPGVVNERQQFALTHPVERGARLRDLHAPPPEILAAVRARTVERRDKRTGLILKSVLAVDR